MYEDRGFGYYSGQSPDWGNTVVNMTSAGATPTPTSVANAINAFTPYLAPETNDSGTTEIKAQAVQSPIAGLVNYANWYFANVNPAEHQRLRLATLPCLADRWLADTGYRRSCLASARQLSAGNVIATRATALTPPTTRPIPMPSPRCKRLRPRASRPTSSDSGQATNPSALPAAQTTLDAMAAAGGTGTYFPGDQPHGCHQRSADHRHQILAQTQSTASAAVNSTGLNANSIVYQSQFVTSDTYQDWTGNLFAFPINASTGDVNTAAPYWSAQPQLDVKARQVRG